MTTLQTEMNAVLADLGIDGSCVNVERNRHLASYDIHLSCRQPVLGKLERSARAIALAIKSRTVPIVRLVPEQGVVRLQVALDVAQALPLKDLYCGERFPKNMVFPMLLGESNDGQKMWVDMNDNPHLLVAGTTGSGKSTLLHALIANGLTLHAMRVNRRVNIYLNDPKGAEFKEYNRPSLRRVIKEVAVSYEETISQLERLAEMMESRYALMSERGLRNIAEAPDSMPLILCIVDEVGDLMNREKEARKGRRLEGLLIKLAQKGRAAGIYLVLATQHPIREVLTSLIKNNFPGRVACKTTSHKGSEVILDCTGAEKLLGRGDAIIQNMKLTNVRFQVAYIEPAQAVSLFEELTARIASLPERN